VVSHFYFNKTTNIMSLVLQINPSLENRVRQNALRKGVDLSQFIVQFLELNFPEEKPKPKALSEREALLLGKIDLAIPVETWERYHILRTKRQLETINASESAEYATINQQIEAANVKRLASLIELAKIRNITLDALMHQLGLTTQDNE
jgi:hypothetical protein